MTFKRILIVEDEIELAELIKDYLEKEGFEVTHAIDGEEGLQQFQDTDPSLVILDLMLPKMDGMELCRRMRSKAMMPIIMMTAKGSDTDKIVGLGIGADDYITKPFSPSELVARVKAHIRRYRYYSEPPNQQQSLKFGNLIIDPNEYKVTLNGQVIDLSAREFKLLHVLASNRGQVFTKDQLFDKVWSYDHMGDYNTLTVYIRKIREKIEHDPSNPVYIKTVWGVGYKFKGE
ncbi:DNA-binding response regulator [Halobacillus andaensis]|uniref:DNA-binding response regulator n=1 Tax=Halobacillus andaensis TaxID=1176239 RepID=A0A917B2Z4_HALAA|nr:response regulator transcription factor [Halobacillus andaensis]MBP2003980.1 DNA-binding response OmpR family regulator [Halobacillus andaensis]GGF14871.1 DNA-binding response regulator [Halobacillus andaensis]